MSLSKLGSSRLQPFQGASSQDVFEIVGGTAPTEVRETTEVAPDLHKQVGQLNSKLNNLRDEQKHLRASLAAKRDEGNALNASIDELTEQLRLAKCEMESQKFNIAQAEGRAKEAEERAAKATKRADRAEGKLDTQNERSESLDAELELVKSKLDTAELDLNQAEMERDIMTKNLRELTETHAALKQKIAEDRVSAAAAVEEARTKAYEAQESDSRARANAVNPLKVVVDGLEATVEALQAKVAVLEADKTQLDENLVEVRTAMKDADEVAEQRVKDSMEAVTKAKASEDRMAHMLQVEETRGKHLTTELRSRLTTMEREVPKLTSTVDSQKEQIEDLSGQLSRCETECQKLQAQNLSLEEDTKRATESEKAALREKAADQEQIESLEQELTKLKRKLFRSTSQALAEKREKKETDKVKMDRAMGALITSRQEEYERCETEKRKRLHIEETAKSLRSRIGFLTTRVDETTSAEVVKSEELDVMRAILALREQHIEKLRHQLAAEKWRNENSESRGRPPRQEGDVDPGRQAHPAVLDFLEGHTEDWLAADAAQLLQAPAISGRERRERRRRKAQAAQLKYVTAVPPIEAVLSRAARGSRGADLVWLVSATELRGSELISSLGIRDILTKLQSDCAPVRRPGEEANGQIFEDVARRLADIATQWRGVEEWSAAEVGSARQAAAVAEARTVRLASAGKQVVSAVEAERVAKQKMVLKFVASVLANAKLEAMGAANTGDKENQAAAAANGSTFITQDAAPGDDGNILLTQQFASSTETKTMPSSRPGVPTIQSLRLADSRIDDELCHGIVTLLMGGEAFNDNDASSAKGLSPAVVEEIVLRGNSITDVGARALAILVRHSPALKRLDLRGNRIGNRGRGVLTAAARGNDRLVEVELTEQDDNGHRIVAQRVLGKTDDKGGFHEIEDVGDLAPDLEGLSSEEKMMYRFAEVSIDLRHNREGRDPKAIIMAAVQDFAKALAEPTANILQTTAMASSAIPPSNTVARPERKPKRTKKNAMQRKVSRGRPTSKQAWTGNDENNDPTREDREGRMWSPPRKARPQQRREASIELAPWDNNGEPEERWATAPAAFAGIDQAEADALLDEHIDAMERELNRAKKRQIRPRAPWLIPKRLRGAEQESTENDRSMQRPMQRPMQRSQSAPPAKRNGRGATAPRVRGPNAALEERRVRDQQRQFSKTANQGNGPRRTSLRREVEIQRQVAEAELIAAEAGYTRPRRKSAGSASNGSSSGSKKFRGKKSVKIKVPAGENLPVSQRIYNKYARAMSPPKRSKEEARRIQKIAGF